MQHDLEHLNTDCVCVTLDRRVLIDAFAREVGDPEFAGRLLAEKPTLLASQPLFLSRRHAARIGQIIAAVEGVTRSDAYRQAVLAYAPDLARADTGPAGVFMGYDFHLSDKGPQLIEINTNAGGALLNAFLAEAQRACCAEVERLVPPPLHLSEQSARFVATFRAEWLRFGAPRPLRRIAIVDAAPEQQYLYPEFVLFQRLFEKHGLEAIIADAAELAFADGVLRVHGQPIDLVYNRLTDFSFEDPRHAALREAYVARAVAVTPNPHVHALFADKRNLKLLTDRTQLAAAGVDDGHAKTLVTGIAGTQWVTPETSAQLWDERNRLFFKPARGYGSRAAYRGDKVTKRVWGDIVAGTYVAQDLVPPSARAISIDGERQHMKVDLRAYTYWGETMLMAARLYQGQTTNMRTPGGGFAPVFTDQDATLSRLNVEDPVTCRCGPAGH